MLDGQRAGAPRLADTRTSVDGTHRYHDPGRSRWEWPAHGDPDLLCQIDDSVQFEFDEGRSMGPEAAVIHGVEGSIQAFR